MSKLQGHQCDQTKMASSDELERAEAAVKAQLYGLSKEQLLHVADHLKIGERVAERQERHGLIKSINRYLDGEEVEAQDDQGLAILNNLQKYMDGLVTPVHTASTTTDTTDRKSPMTFDLNRATAVLAGREFKIYGQIGSPGQVDKLSFNSLARQIEDAQQKGHKEREIISAVTRSVSPGLPLRSYLEGRPAITLPQLRRVLRAHYKERDAIDLYQELAAACQQQKESAHEFFMRTMSLRQRVIFSSQEDQSPLKYDTELVQSTFMQSLKTGLTGSLKGEMRQYLQDPDISDEELLEKLSLVVSLEEKRAEKRGPKPRINTVSASEAEPKSPTAETDQIKQLSAGVQELTACVASLREAMQSPQSMPPRRQQEKGRRERGCPSCREKGAGDECRHCYKCGGDNHIARGCRSGNGPGLPQGDRK